MKTKLIAVLAFIVCFVCNNVKAETTGTKIVGGDLSLVPAYVAAGDSWQDADGNTISTTAEMLAYVKSLGWNSVRVRLFVDPSQDSDPATCQNIDYVRKFGKQIKDAGLNFLVDFHYSDTWADPDSQKIPARWTNKTDAALADSVYAFTKESLQALIAYGATPDYVQIGNEINGGLLWTTTDGEAPSSSDYATYGYCDAWSARSNYSDCWDRLSRFLCQGTKAVREICPEAKIIIHNAIEGNSTYGEYAHTALVNFYTYISQNATYPVSYDIIGLSYYPAWHGTLDYLGITLTNLQTSFPTKEIQVVETGWYYQSYPDDAKFSSSTNPSLDWAVSAEGQYNYLTSLKTKLADYSHVTGVYYWQPEECGNGHSSSGSTNTVMNKWDNRGFWINGTTVPHSLCSYTSNGTTYYPINNIAPLGGTYNESFETTFTNLGFEDDNAATKTPTGWTVNQPNLLSSNGVIAKEDWMKTEVKTGSYVLAVWSDAAKAGHIISQCINVPNGEYTVSVKAYAEGTGYYVCANNDSTAITSYSAGSYTVTTTVTDGRLNIGLSTGNTGTSAYAYFDAFSYTLNSIDGVTYSFDSSTNTASVTGYTSALPVDVVIPSTITYNGTTYTVTSIASEAFKDKTTLNSIHTGNSIISVGANAFNGCTGLNYVCLGTGLTSIGSSAFSGCTNLGVVVLNSPSLTTPGSDVFPSSKVADISLYLAPALYTNKSDYVSLGFNDGTTEGTTNNIAKTSVENGIIYGLWDDMTASVVGYNEDLTAQIIIPSTLHYDTDYVPCTQYFMDQIEQYAFAKATKLTNVTICNNANEIGQSAFRSCSNLAYMTIGEDIATVWENAFDFGSTATRLTIYNKTAPTQWGDDATSPSYYAVPTSNNITLCCPEGSAYQLYSHHCSAYNTIRNTNGEYSASVEYNDQETTDVTQSSLTDNTTNAGGSTLYSTQYVTINRALTEGNYYTLVVPWDLNKDEVTALGITPYYLNDQGCYINDNYLNLTFKQAETMQGGVPYLVYCNTTKENLYLGLEFTNEYKNLISSTKSGTDGSVSLTGLYKKDYIPKGDFFVSGTKLYYTTDDKLYMGAFRAYIHVQVSSGAKPTQITFNLDDGTSTKIETVDAETLIPVDSNIYDLTGRQLKKLPNQRGVYIVNGKKVTVK